MQDHITRRQAIGRAFSTGASVGLAASAAGSLDPLLQRALAAAPARRGRLQDIEHLVILIQENRSFDHYFGTYPGVRGFSDRKGRAAFAQRPFKRAGFHGKLLPFHLATHGKAQCTQDITHAWGPQHRSSNHGRMDRFVAEHLKADGHEVGPLAMGYYTRADIPFYHALADAFTLCDRYHCSVLGPTDPNRLYSMSATLDPDGKQGGPLLETLVGGRAQAAGTLTWTTMPEQLQARGIDWKVYTDPSLGVLDNVLPYFKAFQTNPALQARGLQPTYPHGFRADAKAGRLPQVSWIIGSIAASEHPGFSSAKAGETLARDVVRTLTADPELWAKTALLITWDENGGFFDHVAPPAAPPKTPGEHVTTPTLPRAAQGIRGPIGLGFRVPLLVVSPFSRGGYVCSDVFDHTSLLRLIETRFGAEVPNLSAWRRATTGDLTTTFSFGRVDRSLPRLPALHYQPAAGCQVGGPLELPPNRMPRQRRGRARRPIP
jgi:phospholipase C